MSKPWKDHGYQADLVHSFISYRQSYTHHPQKKPRFGGGATSNGFGDASGASEERRGLMSAGAYEDDGDAVIEMDLLPPRWLDIQDQVTELLSDIATQTRKLEQLHQKHVLPGFDDDAVKKKEEKEIERITSQITRQFGNCQKAIKRIDVLVQESRQNGGINKGEETMANNLKISLATRVGDASTLFRKKQSSYLRSMGNESRRHGTTANTIARNEDLGRHVDAARSRVHSNCPESLHGSITHGLRNRPLFFAINAPSSATASSPKHLQQRHSDSTPRTRNRRHSPVYH